MNNRKMIIVSKCGKYTIISFYNIYERLYEYLFLRYFLNNNCIIKLFAPLMVEAPGCRKPHTYHTHSTVLLQKHKEFRFHLYLFIYAIV